MKVCYAKTIDPRTLKFRFLIEKYFDSLPKDDGPCQVIRENCRDQKVKQGNRGEMRDTAVF